MPTLETLPETATPQTKTPIKLGEFHGAFAKFQTCAYGELNRAGLPAEVSHKVANDFGSNIGDALRNASDSDIAAKVAKAKSNGQSQIKIGAKGFATTSYAMSLIRVVQVIDGLYSEGLLNSRALDTSSLVKQLGEYVAKSKVWASEQVWE